MCYRLNTENDHLGKSCGNGNWFFDKIAYIEQQVRKTLVENMLSGIKKFKEREDVIWVVKERTLLAAD